MDRALSKKLRKELLELQSLAWKRELEEELGNLEKLFSSWHEGAIDAFQLSDQIHRFHNGVSRELYNRYSGSHYQTTVPSAVAYGKISESEVSEELLEIISEYVEHLRTDFESGVR